MKNLQASTLLLGSAIKKQKKRPTQTHCEPISDLLGDLSSLQVMFGLVV
jgi:hypothetical protein